MSDILGTLKEQIVGGLAAASQGQGPFAKGSAGSYMLMAPKKMRPRHRQAIMLHEAGFDQKQIAEMLGYTQGRVSIILNSRRAEVEVVRHEARKLITDRTMDVATRIQASAHEMLDITIHHARNKADAANSRLAARDLLHMAGFSPVKKTASINATVPVPQEVADALGMLDKTQEVFSRQSEWTVTTPEQKTETKDAVTTQR